METLEGRSRLGRGVRLTEMLNDYFGAQPYFAVSYQHKPKAGPVLRYTPSRARAQVIYDRFLEDITDPEGLR